MPYSSGNGLYPHTHTYIIIDIHTCVYIYIYIYIYGVCTIFGAHFVPLPGLSN